MRQGIDVYKRQVEAYNASVLQAQSAAQAEQAQSGYRDGTYEGSALDVYKRQAMPSKMSTNSAMAAWGLRFLQPAPDAMVLDCGCGGGANIKRC